jgi:hypothetical protein
MAYVHLALQTARIMRTPGNSKLFRNNHLCDSPGFRSRKISLRVQESGVNAQRIAGNYPTLRRRSQRLFNGDY